MKKTEKIERLLTLRYYGISEEKLNEIAKKWSHKGLDFLTEMWHKYYNTKAHEAISYHLVKWSEKQLNLEYMEEALKSISPVENPVISLCKQLMEAVK